LGHLKKVQVNLKIKTPSGKLLKTQQVFLRFTHLETNHEAIFVGQASAKQYSFSISIEENLEVLDYQSGDYSVELIVGDPFIQNSFKRVFATLSLSLPNPPAAILQQKEKRQQKPETKKFNIVFV